MSFNLPPVQPNQPNFFARQGTRVLTSQASLSNLDEIVAGPSFNVNPTKTTPKLNKLPSLTNLDQYDRPPMFVRKDEANGNYGSVAPMDQQNKIIPPGFVIPQQGLLRSPINNNNKKANNSYDMMIAQNMYGFAPQHPGVKNISFSEGGTPKSYDNALLRPMGHKKTMQPVSYPSSMLLPNINNVYPRPYSLLPSGNVSYESVFGRRLEEQHKLLDKLMIRLGKEAEDSDGSDTDTQEKAKKKSIAKQMANRRQQKVYTNMLPLQNMKIQQRIPKIAERGEAEEYSPNVHRKGNRGDRSSRNKNNGTLNYIDSQDNSPQGDSIERDLNFRNDKKGRVYKSLNDLGDGLVSKRKLTKGRQQDDDSDEEYGLNKNSARKGGLKSSKTVKIKTNIMGSDSEPSVQFMSRRGRRDLAHARLRIVGWSLVYYHLLYNSVKSKVLVQREHFLRNISENIFALSGIIESYVLQTAGRQIQEMITNKSCEFIFISDKVPLSKKLDKECETLFIHYKNILDRLFTFTKTLPDHLFALLATISEEGSQLPHDYFTEFEIRRQQFTYFGKLKYVTAAKSKLIIGGVILRILVHQIIMKPWDAFKMEADKIDRLRLLNIGSLLYNVFMEVLKGLVPIFHHNQSFLSIDLKVKPKRTLLQALDLGESEQKFNIQKEATRDGEIIDGFYSKQQLACFFNDRKK